MSKSETKLAKEKIMTDVRQFIEGLPFVVKEEPPVNCVYSGAGVVETGSVGFFTLVKVKSKDDVLTISVDSPRAGVHATIPFQTMEDRVSAHETVKKLIPKWAN